MGLSERLERAGLVLPKPLPIRGRYRAVVVRNGIAYTSGVMATTGPPLQVAWPGRVGAEVSLDDARTSARGALLATLSNLRAALGDLDQVQALLHLCGYVNAEPGFDKVHHVVGAASELVGELFGDHDLPARTAIGVATLPERASVVLDTVVAVVDERQGRKRRRN